MLALCLDGAMLAISLWMLLSNWKESQVRSRGEKVYAKVLSVDHVIPTGWHKFRRRVDGSFDCDYILTLQVKERIVKTIVRSRMRILGGNRVLRYGVGDKVEIFSHKSFPNTVLPVEGTRGDGLFALVVWSFCSITTFSIGLYLIIAG